MRYLKLENRNTHNIEFKQFSVAGSKFVETETLPIQQLDLKSPLDTRHCTVGFTDSGSPPWSQVDI